MSHTHVAIAARDGRSLGELVRQERERLGLTQHELALRIGAQGSFVSKIERGRVKQPSLQFIVPLAEALDLPLSALYEAAGGVPAPDADTDAGTLPPDLQDFVRWIATLPEATRQQIYQAAQNRTAA